MAARRPQSGRCPPSGSRQGVSRPGMTRTEMLRQAKTAAIVQKEPREVDARPGGKGGRGPRTGLAKVGPPCADPKKVDFKRPGMTKAMQMRQRAAEEKMKRQAEVQRNIEENKRCPRRTPAPVGGDARAGRERPPGRRSRDRVERLQEAISKGHVVTRRGEDAADAALDQAVARGHITKDRQGGGPGRSRMEQPRNLRRGPLAAGTPIPSGAKQLAKSMNAEVVQAVPMSDAPVDKIIIEPGIISEDRNTIVCITRPGGAEGASSPGAAGIANRSIQVISETLDEQDAVESAAVQGKLEDLQQARRSFVIAVANVGGNAVSFSSDNEPSILDMDEMADDFDCIARSPSPRRRIVNLPDVSHEMFRVNYGLNHPKVVEAREFSKRLQSTFEQEAAERRIEEGFAAQAQRDCDEFRFDAPLEQDIMEGDVSFEEDEDGTMIPCDSRIKASMPPIPKRREVCAERPITIQELQRFMDLEAYPPVPGKQQLAPHGRENLNPDLWEVEDPWYFEERERERSDLIRFDVSC